LSAPARGRLAAEPGGAHTARERGPIRSSRERRIDQSLGQAEPAQVRGDADRALAAPGVPVDIVLREAPVVEDAACSELGDHLPRGAVLKSLRTQPRAQLGAGEIPPGQQRDGGRAHSLGICALLHARRFG